MLRINKVSIRGESNKHTIPQSRHSVICAVSADATSCRFSLCVPRVAPADKTESSGHEAWDSKLIAGVNRSGSRVSPCALELLISVVKRDPLCLHLPASFSDSLNLSAEVDNYTVIQLDGSHVHGYVYCMSRYMVLIEGTRIFAYRVTCT